LAASGHKFAVVGTQGEGLAVLGPGAALAQRTRTTAPIEHCPASWVMVTLCPAGQVTVLARVDGEVVAGETARHGRCQGMGLMSWACPAARSPARVSPLP
jgi:hypothetical protein